MFWRTQKQESGSRRLEGIGMKITFLGTGGGRITVVSQLRASGGWVLEMDGQIFHIDPGPGALVRAKQYGFDLKKVTGILISHAHPDHCADAEMIVEAMTEWVNKKKGVIIGNVNSIKGSPIHRPVFSSYHLNAAGRYEILEPGKSTEVGKVKVTATPTEHGEQEEDGIGFVFEGEKKIGYTSDGEYFKGMEDHFRGCDVLVINCLRPRKEKWPTHMNIEQAADFISRAKPRLSILNHFGYKMLNAGPEKEAAWVEKQTGIRTIAAKDGMVLESDNGEIKTSMLEKREV